MKYVRFIIRMVLFFLLLPVTLTGATFGLVARFFFFGWNLMDHFAEWLAVEPPMEKDEVAAIIKKAKKEQRNY
jgi:hypothetical protein